MTTMKKMTMIQRMTSPQATNPRVTSPQVTNPQVTNPRVTSPQEANPQATSPQEAMSPAPVTAAKVKTQQMTVQMVNRRTRVA